MACVETGTVFRYLETGTLKLQLAIDLEMVGSTERKKVGSACRSVPSTGNGVREKSQTPTNNMLQSQGEVWVIEIEGRE